MCIRDRSTDSTSEIIRNFADSAPFPVRFNLNPVNLGGTAKGITKNFEQASRLCTGDLIAFCDQDDVWLPQKLARMNCKRGELLFGCCGLL